MMDHGPGQVRDLRRAATLANANVAAHSPAPTGQSGEEEEEEEARDVADPLTNLDEMNAELVQAATAVEVVEDEGEMARQMMEDGLAEFGTTVFASEFGNVVARTGAGPTVNDGR